MGQLFSSATKRSTLRAAWNKIRSNGLVSSAEETVEAVRAFERDSEKKIAQIQSLLRTKRFEFEPQKGILKKKNSGAFRGIVMASVENRVVERAWLDTLQKHSIFVRDVLNFPTSVGGVPHRSVPHGLKLIRDAFEAKKLRFIRSDISGFFDNIPRKRVLDQIAQDVDDENFLEILTAATRVTLGNEQALGENRKVFPTGDMGVAQGSPLSPLFGNILLHDFDLQMNSQGIVCVRFIDDFVLLGEQEGHVHKAFNSACKTLNALGLNCHDPFKTNTKAEKASVGSAESGFVFLGYDIRPGLFQPSKAARAKLVEAIDSHIRVGRRTILEVKKESNCLIGRQKYVQTLTVIDKVVRGWGEAFAYGNSGSTLQDLDLSIDERLNQFRRWFAAQMKGVDWKTKRRLGGVCLLEDIRTKSLDDVPFLLEKGLRFSRSARTITISTDGSIVAGMKKLGKEYGRGGWAFVVHGSMEERSGYVDLATNNQMELRAVIEAIKSVPQGGSVLIRTDSQYVCDVVNGPNVIKANADLWHEYREISKGRRVKVVWVKGHCGDVHNERADYLARIRAQSSKAA